MGDKALHYVIEMPAQVVTHYYAERMGPEDEGDQMR